MIIINNMEMETLFKEVDRTDKRIKELKAFFYPEVYSLELADSNLTKCLKELK